jgi:hypothetical protein
MSETTETTENRIESKQGRTASAGLPPELFVFGFAMLSVVALVVAPHRIGLGF